MMCALKVAAGAFAGAAACLHPAYCVVQLLWVPEVRYSAAGGRDVAVLLSLLLLPTGEAAETVCHKQSVVAAATVAVPADRSESSDCIQRHAVAKHQPKIRVVARQIGLAKH